MKKSYLIYVLIAFGLWILAIALARGNHLIFVDPLTAMIIVVIPMFIMLSHFGPGEIINSFFLAWRGNGAGKEFKNAILFFETAQKLMYASGVIGLVCGIVLMMDAYPMKTEFFARGFGTTILSIMYPALMASLVTLPFRSALQKKLNEME